MTRTEDCRRHVLRDFGDILNKVSGAGGDSSGCWTDHHVQGDPLTRIPNSLTT